MPHGGGHHHGGGGGFHHHHGGHHHHVHHHRPRVQWAPLLECTMAEDLIGKTYMLLVLSLPQGVE